MLNDSEADCNAWSVSDHARYTLLVAIEADLATRLADVSEMMNALHEDGALNPVIGRYSELVAMLRELRTVRIALASNYGLELLLTFYFQEMVISTPDTGDSDGVEVRRLLYSKLSTIRRLRRIYVYLIKNGPPWKFISV